MVEIADFYFFNGLLGCQRHRTAMQYMDGAHLFDRASL